jgi:hypothetical protein
MRSIGSCLIRIGVLGIVFHWNFIASPCIPLDVGTKSRTFNSPAFAEGQTKYVFQFGKMATLNHTISFVEDEEAKVPHFLS